MKIRLLTSIATVAGGFAEGEVIDWPDPFAIRLIESGQAVPHVERELERAVVSPVVERRSRRAARDAS